VPWNLSTHHGDAVLGANVRRDLGKQTMTVTIRPGHAADFTIELDRGRHEQPRLSALITGCGGGESFWRPLVLGDRHRRDIGRGR
jgi:hypothetical protein